MEETAIILLYDLLSQKERVNRRDVKHLRYYSDPFSLNETEFRKSFRLRKSVCKSVIKELEPYATWDSSISFTIRFLAALNFFVTGSYQKSVGRNSIAQLSQPSVSRCIKEISQVLVQQKGDEVQFPKSDQEIAAVTSGFYRQFGIDATIGVVDCAQIAIVSPPASNKERSLYMNQHGYNSINVEATCDHRYIFTSANAKFPGSYQDSTIWQTSQVRQHLMQTATTSEDFWLIGDQAYPLEPWLLTPFAAPTGRQQAKYNHIHAKARNVIETAFGVLRDRFGCLSKQHLLYYSHSRAADIIYACIILHNIAMKSGASEDLDVAGSMESTETLHNEYENFFIKEGECVRDKYVSSLNND